MAISFAAFTVLIIAYLLFKTNLSPDHLYWLVGGFFLLAFLQQGMT